MKKKKQPPPLCIPSEWGSDNFYTRILSLTSMGLSTYRLIDVLKVLNLL